jgi:hypothetical protein
VLVELTPEGERILAALSRTHRDELTSAAPALIRALLRLVETGSDEVLAAGSAMRPEAPPRA